MKMMYDADVYSDNLDDNGEALTAGMIDLV